MRKSLCVILALIICNFSIFSYAVNEVDTNETNTEKNDIKTEQETLKNQINDETEKLEEVQNELSENLRQVQKLDEKIADSQIELDKISVEIAKLQVSIDEVEKKLKVEQEKYGRQKDILDKRLVAMYETSDTYYLDVMLNSKSVSEFLSNYFLITELAECDTSLLRDMKKQKDSIEVEMAKLDKTRDELAVKKANSQKTEMIMKNTKSVRENFIAKLSDEEKDIQSKIDEYNTRFAEINAEILRYSLGGIDTKYIGGELAWPVPGYTKISSEYGMRTHPITGVFKLHTGVDISAPMGADFIAANDGIVVKAEFNSAYGNMVVIDHGGGVSTLYAHGSEIVASVGQTVKRGDIVLKVGSTGYSTGPHAHFEVRLNGIVTNPMPYITNGLIPLQQEENKTNENTSQENISQENITN